MRAASILDTYLADGTPPNVALMSLLAEARSPDEARGWIDRRRATAPATEEARLRTLVTLLYAHPDAWARIRAVLAEADHAAGADPAGWGRAFDRIAAISPDAGAALYGLGCPDLLDAATAEIVRLVRALDLVGPRRDLLEIGCGWGRLTLALASAVRSAVALDVSAAMIARARSRAGDRAHLRFDVTDGSDLASVPSGSVDLVLAADVFPYLVASGAGLARRHIEEAARVLRPGGSLLVLNYSYRGDDALDRTEFATSCAEAGLSPEREGTRDLALWDGRTYLARIAG